MAFRHLLIGASVLSVATSAFAQDSDNVNDVLFDEIVTYGTKSVDPENVQDVAIAVTSANAETLEALNVQTLEDLTFYAPNVVLSDIGTARGTANFSIRGLGINSSIPSIDPTVGVFIDGQYLGQNAGVVFDTFDLESVEILRGPQGLLFGRNTTGGAVLVNTSNPTDEVEVEFRAAVESALKESRGDANTTVSAVLRGPIVEDVLNAKLAVYNNNDNGYFQKLDPTGVDANGNTTYSPGDDVGKANTTIVRGGLDFLLDKFIPDANLLVKGEWFSSNGDGPVAQNRAFFERDTFDASYDNVGFYDNEIWTGSATLSIPVPFGENGQITNILASRDYAAETDGDIDALPVFLFHSNTELAQDQWSNEFRYNGTFGNADLTAGVFYFEQDTAYTEVRALPTIFPFGQFYGGGDQEHDVLGLFANVDFALSDQLIVTGGLRYSEENKDVDITYVRPRNPCTFVDTANIGPRCLQGGLNSFLQVLLGAQEPNGFSDSDSWSNLTPKLAVQYFMNDDLNLYASYTKGFRSGGYNFRVTDVALFLQQVALNGGQLSFDEEETDAFEIGAKYTSPDRRTILNASGFYNAVSDLQRELNLPSPTSGVSQFITNSADADILGLELEGRFRASDMFTLTGNIGYINASYSDVFQDLNGDGVINAADEDLELPRVPEFTYGVGVIADFGDINGRVSFQHRDENAYTDNNLGYIQPIDDLQAALNWQTPVEGVSLGIYGENLLDEVQAGGDTQTPFAGPLSTGNPQPFAFLPAGGTFSPLKKGRVFGIELNITLDGDR